MITWSVYPNEQPGPERLGLKYQTLFKCNLHNLMDCPTESLPSPPVLSSTPLLLECHNGSQPT